MKCFFFASILSLLVIFTGDTAPPAQDTRGQAFYAPIHDYRVTISSANNRICVLEVPKGVNLSVEAEVDFDDPFADDILKVFDGHIVIRLRPRELVEDWEGPNMTDIMARSPLEIELLDGHVTVEFDDDAESNQK